MRLQIRTKPGRQARSAGFTIPEVLVAMTLSSIVFVTLVTGIGQGFSTVEQARHKQRATQILLEKLEVVRLYTWTQINDPDFVPETFEECYQPAGKGGITYTGTIQITNADDVDPAYASSMRKLVAQVTWTSGGIQHQQTMETLISEYGVQNYIY